MANANFGDDKRIFMPMGLQGAAGQDVWRVERPTEKPKLASLCLC